jgi:hypothetical protein
MAIVTVGIDLAKNVFAVHGVDAIGEPVLIRPSVARTRLAGLTRGQWDSSATAYPPSTPAAKVIDLSVL